MDNFLACFFGALIFNYIIAIGDRNNSYPFVGMINVSAMSALIVWTIAFLLGVY